MNAAPSTAGRDSGPQGVGWPALALGAVVLLALLGYALGPGLASTSDARHYLSAAGSFARGGQLLNPDGTPYTSWGPWYPVLLSLGASRINAWAPALQVGSTLLCWAGWSWLAGQLLPQRRVAALLTLGLALPAPWLITAKYLWSEPVFQALFAGYAVALYRYLRRPCLGWWLAGTLAGLLLVWQRTSGLFLVLGVGLGLLLAYGPGLRRHWRAALWHAVLIGAGAGAWLLYAARAAAVPELYRSRGWQGLRETLGDYGYLLTRWLVPVQQPGWPKHWLFELLLPALLLGLALLAWRSRTRFGRLLGVVMLTYLLCLIGTTVMSRAGGNVYDGERYAAVIYGPGLLLLGDLAARLSGHRRWVPLLLAAWLLYPAVRAVKVADFCHRMQVEALRVPGR